MQEERTPEALESARSEYERQEQKQEYVPRPKWHIVMAWVLIAIVILGIINLCYWQMAS